MEKGAFKIRRATHKERKARMSKKQKDGQRPIIRQADIDRLIPDLAIRRLREKLNILNEIRQQYQTLEIDFRQKISKGLEDIDNRIKHVENCKSLREDFIKLQQLNSDYSWILSPTEEADEEDDKVDQQ